MSKNKNSNNAKVTLTPEERERRTAEIAARMEARKKELEAKAAEVEKEETKEEPAPKNGKAKKEVDPNLISVADLARNLNLDPKAARAKLRRARGKAPEGRWSMVVRGSDEEKALVAIFTSKKESSEASN